MKRPYITFALALAALLLSHAAQARFIDGFLAQCTTVSQGSCIENTAVGYARQPISLQTPSRGYLATATPYTFGSGGIGSIGGHAIFDQPVAGNLLEVLPLATPNNFSAGSPDAADVGSLGQTILAMAGFSEGAAYSGAFPAASNLGVTTDGSVTSTGVALAFTRGVVSAVMPATSTAYRVASQVAGFAATVPPGVQTYVIAGAGTLASGALGLPANPADGQILQLACAVTVTALSVAPAAGQTLSGAPTTCGPALGHEWRYVGGTIKTWFMLGS